MRSLSESRGGSKVTKPIFSNSGKRYWIRTLFHDNKRDLFATTISIDITKNACYNLTKRLKNYVTKLFYFFFSLFLCSDWDGWLTSEINTVKFGTTFVKGLNFSLRNNNNNNEKGGKKNKKSSSSIIFSPMCLKQIKTNFLSVNTLLGIERNILRSFLSPQSAYF